VARTRLVEFTAKDVELSPGKRAIVTQDEVLLLRRGSDEAMRLTIREAQVLAAVVGTTDAVNLNARRSG